MANGMGRPPVADTTEGQPKAVGANGDTPFVHRGAAGKPDGDGLTTLRKKRRAKGATISFRASTGATWRYNGKRGRVLSMLATMPAGLTHWDCLPWHTRLGGTIHALRRDGLVINTDREGEYRHARYRLETLGRLIKEAENRGAGV